MKDHPTSRIITINKAVVVNDWDGIACCATMSVRRRSGRPTAHRPCPNQATHNVGTKPYCDEHGPDRYRVDPYYHSKPWRALRTQVLERDNDACQYCGKAAKQADHIIPRKSGGVDDLSNLVACCPTCNKAAGGQIFASFRAKKRFLLAQRKL